MNKIPVEKYYRGEDGQMHRIQKRPEPRRKNRNKWYLQNQKDPCREIYELGQEYIHKMEDPKERPRRRMKNPVALVKLFYWLWLTGGRQQEAFKKPYPTITIAGRGDKVAVISTHLNQKQKDKKDEVVATIPVFDEWEQAMWNFITDGGREEQGENIFQYKSWHSTANNNITQLFKYAFTTTLIDPDDPDPKTRIHRASPLIPHILRHARAFNVLMNHGMRDDKTLVKKWFGWKSDAMLDYYPNIGKVLSTEDQMDILEKEGKLTNLKIDASELLTSSDLS
jgi:hypothetical protein